MFFYSKRSVASVLKGGQKMQNEEYISEEQLDDLFVDAKRSQKHMSEMETFGVARKRIKSLLVESFSYTGRFPVEYVVVKFQERNYDDAYVGHGKWDELQLAKNRSPESEDYFKSLLVKYFDIEKISEKEWKITLKK